jgi:circadian clock protein KaiC
MDGTTAPLSARAGTGIEGLDHILGGGLPRARLYLVNGDPGAGKTTLALQFLLEGVRRGEPVLYVTFSETEGELREVAASHGWSLEGLTVCDMSASEESLRAETQYTLFYPSEVELGETTKAVMAEAERVQPMRAVFDSLSEVRLLARDSLRYRRQILALKQFFTGRRCTVMLLDDRVPEAGDLQLASLAHGVLLLEQRSPEYGGARRRLCVAKMRALPFRSGYHDFDIRTGGIIVYPRLVAAEHHRDFVRERVSSGVPELDVLLGGGLDRGTSTLILGPAGVGKSTLATQFAVATAARGERAAVFTFEENLQAFLARAETTGLDAREHLQAGRLLVRSVDPAELTPGEFSHGVCQAVERDQALLVVIDSLNGYLNAMADERFLSAHLHELLAYLNQQGVVTLLVMGQHGLVGTGMQAPVDLSYLSDATVLLRYFESQGRVRRAISMIKKRTGPHELTIRDLRIGAGGLRLGQPLQNFQGVLTGTPTYYSGPDTLFDDEEPDVSRPGPADAPAGGSTLSEE